MFRVLPGDARWRVVQAAGKKVRLQGSILFPPTPTSLNSPLRCRGPCSGPAAGRTSSPGMQVVPSTQHIPTTVILSGPEAGAEHRRRCWLPESRRTSAWCARACLCASVSVSSASMSVECASVSLASFVQPPLTYQWVPWVWRSYVGVLGGCAVEHFPQSYTSIHLSRALPLESAICLVRRRLQRLEPLYSQHGH